MSIDFLMNLFLDVRMRCQQENEPQQAGRSCFRSSQEKIDNDIFQIQTTLVSFEIGTLIVLVIYPLEESVHQVGLVARLVISPVISHSFLRRKDIQSTENE